MKLKTEKYLTQNSQWPQKGKVILAQYDEESIVVYQAYRSSIGHFAVTHKYFGGDFKLDRMSWIKPNFLWMMYRSGWGTKDGQEVILAITLKREAFDQILSLVVHSSFDSSRYANEKDWKYALKSSSVRLQWDPDHDPIGTKLTRKAIQLGLRNETLEKYSKEWVLDIEDISEFVKEQRSNARPTLYENLVTPKENLYLIKDPELAKRVGASTSENMSL